ncbi:acid-sensing ion channel 4-A-like [Hyalella azteca]|uniref:Acid-sensing ion channel 4-A-like n=1 Tax=Hyalella azteca TaxID=294128 RepID=A0A8B7NH26_HYAAZ|nr:acid-sensing ion channel 4-A-like [Hyalella azteca]
MRKTLRKWLKSGPKLGIDHIQLVGLSVVASGDVHWTRRVTWFLFLCCGVGLAIFYIGIQVSLFSAGYIGVTVHASSNTTTHLPAITVCAEQKYDFNNLHRLWLQYRPGSAMPEDAEMQLLDVANLSLSDIWTRGGYEKKELVRRCLLGPGTTCEDLGSWSSVFTEYGLCFTYTGGMTRLDGPLYGLYLQLNYSRHPFGQIFKGYKIAIHDIRSPAAFRINDGFKCPVRNEKFGCYLLRSVAMQTISQLNRRNAPCTSVLGYDMQACLSSCVYSEVARRAGCRLPYMDVSWPECRGRKQVENALNVAKEQIFSGKFNMSLCNCPKPCTYVMYTEHGDTTWNYVRTSTVKVYLTSIEKHSLVETYTYVGADLGGDIGGIIGLMLGASVLTAVQVLEVITSRSSKFLAARMKTGTR